MIESSVQLLGQRKWMKNLVIMQPEYEMIARLVAQKEPVMEDPVFDGRRSQTILNQVREDMRVCDSAGEEIGRVREVFLGAVAGSADRRGPATASTPQMRDESLIDQLAEAFSDNPLPEVLRERLLREGFIRIDTHGLFASDRFALPDQIESVSDDCVRLRLAKDELIER